MANDNHSAEKRVPFRLARDILERVDEHRWRARMPSRAAAVRALIEIGLNHAEDYDKSSPKGGVAGQAKRRSSPVSR